MTTETGCTYAFPSHCARDACLDMMSARWKTFVVHDAKAANGLPS